MPKYEFSCSNGHSFEEFLPVARMQTPYACPCGARTRRLITAPLLVLAQAECRYDSPIDGTPITSWSQRREDLARHNCQEYDPQMKTDYLRRQKESEQALEREVDESVEKAIAQMPYRERARLHSELVEQGMTAEVERLTA